MRSSWKFVVIITLIIASPSFFVGCGAAPVPADTSEGESEEVEDEEEPADPSEY